MPTRSGAEAKAGTPDEGWPGSEHPGPDGECYPKARSIAKKKRRELASCRAGGVALNSGISNKTSTSRPPADRDPSDRQEAIDLLPRPDEASIVDDFRALGDKIRDADR